MEKRAEKAHRLLSVLHQLQQIEERKKHALQRRYDELQRSQLEVIHALNRDDALHGLFVDNTARFLKNLAQEAQQVAEARDRQSKKILDRASKVKTAERLKDALDTAVARRSGEKELQDTIERYTGRRGASLP
jgi:hypothetical protein